MFSINIKVTLIIIYKHKTIVNLEMRLQLRLFSSFIVKTKNPCINCIHYIDERLQYPPDSYLWDTKFGWCSKFGKEHLVTGEIIYEDAIVCRTHESKCGKEGKYYTDKTVKKINGG